MKNNSLVTGIIVVLVGALGFFGGMKYQQSKATAGNSGRQFPGGRQGGQNGQGRSAGFGRPVSGEILNQDDKSITVKLADGSSKIVIVNDKTTINMAQSATKSDIQTGQTVAVFGSENADGTVTAQSIQLNPQFRMGGPREATTSPSPAP